MIGLIDVDGKIPNWLNYIFCKKYGGWISWDDYNRYRREEKKAKKIV